MHIYLERHILFGIYVHAQTNIARLVYCSCSCFFPHLVRMVPKIEEGSGGDCDNGQPPSATDIDGGPHAGSP